MSNFATHKPVIEFLLKSRPISRILETGMGLYSTGAFLESAKELISIEMQNEEWYQKVKEEFHDHACDFRPLLLLKAEETYSYIEKLKSKSFDMAFIDGNLDRWRQINYTLDKTDLIVAHDTEATCYFWGLVKLPASWYWVDIIPDHGPWTAVLTPDTVLVEDLKEHFNCTAYDSKSFENKNYMIYNHNLGLVDMKIHTEKLEKND